ncbi:hypothetical protein GCM10010324_44340 [Streptomyces hiroshimensis]|uniref:Uncharacterized protein n=1 Tax=Streptomyces hiroshimensis TaxID=66424 RepID=A0ABQ2YV44_9ACTN|nr:hypothetical protein GCM10010324_44340 [Streptomyces hiroshimensis]
MGDGVDGVGFVSDHHAVASGIRLPRSLRRHREPGEGRALVGADDDVPAVHDVVDRPDRGQGAAGEDDPAQGDAAQEQQGLGAAEFDPVTGRCGGVAHPSSTGEPITAYQGPFGPRP